MSPPTVRTNMRRRQLKGWLLQETESDRHQFEQTWAPSPVPHPTTMSYFNKGEIMSASTCFSRPIPKALRRCDAGDSPLVFRLNLLPGVARKLDPTTYICSSASKEAPMMTSRAHQGVPDGSI